MRVFPALAVFLSIHAWAESPPWLANVQREVQKLLRPSGAAQALDASAAETLAVLKAIPASSGARQIHTVLESELARLDLALQHGERSGIAGHPRAARLRSRLQTALSAARNGNASAAQEILTTLPSEFAPAPVDPALQMQDGPLSERPLRAVFGMASLPAARTADSPELSSTPIVLLAPEVVSRAAALGNDPLRIYAHVHDQFEFVPYPELRQNALTAIWSQNGNDFDQATALIGLMRAAGIPARYVTGTVRVPLTDMMNWIGARDAGAARAIIDRAFLVPAYQGTDVRFTHTWVEANFDAGEGAKWYPLDPSFKLKDYRPAITAPKLPFDRNQFLATVKPNLASEVYLEQVLAWLRGNRAGASLSDLAWRGSVRPGLTGTTPPPLPYTVESTLATRPELERTFQNQIIFSVFSTTSPQTFFETTLSLAEISHQSLTLSFGPANEFRGTSTNRVPQLRLDEKIVAAGDGGTLTSPNVAVQIQVRDYNANKPYYAIHSSFPSTHTGAFTLGGVQVSDALLASRAARLLAQPAALAANDGARTREMLAIAGLRYYQRRNQERQRISDAMQVRYVPVLVEEGLTRADLSATSNLADRPFVSTPNLLIIDLQSSNDSVYDLNSATSDLKSIFQMLGATSSGLEHQIWEEIALTPAISTIKLLQSAVESGSVLRTFDANGNSDIAGIPIPDSYRQLMLSEVRTGKTIVTISRQITFRGYTGVAWISELPNGVGSYFISQLNGGQALTPYDPAPSNQEPIGDPRKTGGETKGDPVTVNNGNLFYSNLDFTIRGHIPIHFRRYYNGLSRADSPFGIGWTHAYNASLKDNQSTVRYTDESGGAFDFTLRGNSYESPTGLYMTLAKDAQGYNLTTRHGVSYRFNLLGKLVSITDRNTNVLRLTYDPGGRLQTITDSTNRSVTLSYNGQNRITGIADSSGRSQSYIYDAGGNLASATDFSGARTTYSYYSGAPFDHTLKSVTMPEGQTTSWEFYGNGRVSKIVQPGGASTQFLYMPLRNETLVFDERGFPTTYTYNASGNVTRVALPDGNIITKSKGGDGRLSSASDPSGFIRSYVRDPRGNIIRITEGTNVTTLTYDPVFNFMTSRTDPLGNVTRWEYDTRGNLTKITPPTGDAYTLAYNAAGDLISWRDGDGNIRSFNYDPIGQISGANDAAGNSAQYTYDAVGRITGAAMPDGSSYALAYDAMDRLTSYTDPLGSTWTVSYDRNGNPVSRTDANGNVTAIGYDARDTIAQVTDPLSQITQYSSKTPECNCEASEVLAAYSDAANRTWSYQYDFANRITAIRDPMGASTRLIYDAKGNLASKTDANGNTINYEYDPRGLLTRKVFPDGADVRFSYDANGNVLSASNRDSTLTYSYDESGRLAAALDTFTGSRVGYSYDQAGRLATVTDPEGRTTNYQYDGNGRIAKITGPSGLPVAFTYDANGRRSSLSHGNNLQSDYSYDAAGRVTSIAGIASTAYTYDSNGNTTSAGSNRFSYDALDRVLTGTETSVYDAAGNRGSASSIFDAANHLLSDGSATYSYDANGNLVARSDGGGSASYSYDFENRLIAIDRVDGGRISFKYDALGRRIEKNTRGVITQYVYDHEKILFTLSGSGQRLARYIHGPRTDEPLIAETSNGTFFYHADAQGNITAVTDSTGASVTTCSYFTFGAGGCQSPPATPDLFLFAGREFDADTGLYYFRARYYDPATGRFLSPDPLDLGGSLLARDAAAAVLGWDAAMVNGGSRTPLATPHRLHGYNYAASNPLRFGDPSGLKPEDNKDWTEEFRKKLEDYLDALRRAQRELGDPLNWRTDPKTGLPVFDPYSDPWHFPPPPPPPPPDPDDPLDIP